MTALPLANVAARPTLIPAVHEPIALLQLDLSDVDAAATAVYREVRQGRRVVAVASGRPDASSRLAEALDAIGVAAVQPAPGEALLSGDVAIVPGPDLAVSHSRPGLSRPQRVGLAGCGVVGGGVLSRLLADPRFEVVGVLVRDPKKARDEAIPPGLTLSDPAALLAREPDVVVEAISDASTGLALIRAALSRGIAVVSANKQAVGRDLSGLTALAKNARADLLYSASVGGGAPLIETVRRAADRGAVVRIEAVLNGTCNFILNRLAEGNAFDDALTAARDAGFAEADPRADLTGLDAAAKLVILAHEGLYLRLRIETVTRKMLAADTVLPGGRVRQIARLDLISGQSAVAFEAVDGDALFAHLPDEANAIRVTLADGQTLTAVGRGAGRRPTTESVWADLEDLVQAEFGQDGRSGA